MLGEKRIVAFSPELGTENSGSNDFYPSLDIIFNEILPKNLNSALYGIQRAGYYLRFYSIKNNYLECSIIQNYKHKFMDQNDDEKKELQICFENNHLYQFSNTIALKNTGFSDFRGKIKVKLLINLSNAKYISIKSDSGSNKNVSHNKNSNKNNSQEGSYDSNFNSRKSIIIERNITEQISSMDNFLNENTKNLFFYDSDNNNLFLLSEVELENIDSQNFYLIDVKIYFEKDYITDYFKEPNNIKQTNNKSKENTIENINKFFSAELGSEISKHPETLTFDKIDLKENNLIFSYLENEYMPITEMKMQDFIKNNQKLHSSIRSKTNDNQTVFDALEVEKQIKDHRLYFINDNYKIKIEDFDLFAIKQKAYQKFSLAEGFIDLVVYSTLMFFFIISIMFILYKIKICMQNRQLKKQMEEANGSGGSSNLNGKKYLELENVESSVSLP